MDQGREESGNEMSPSNKEVLHAFDTISQSMEKGNNQLVEVLMTMMSQNPKYVNTLKNVTDMEKGQQNQIVLYHKEIEKLDVKLQRMGRKQQKALAKAKSDYAREMERVRLVHEKTILRCSTETARETDEIGRLRHQYEEHVLEAEEKVGQARVAKAELVKKAMSSKPVMRLVDIGALIIQSYKHDNGREPTNGRGKGKEGATAAGHPEAAGASPKITEVPGTPESPVPLGDAPKGAKRSRDGTPQADLTPDQRRQAERERQRKERTDVTELSDSGVYGWGVVGSAVQDLVVDESGSMDIFPSFENPAKASTEPFSTSTRSLSSSSGDAVTTRWTKRDRPPFLKRPKRPARSSLAKHAGKGNPRGRGEQTPLEDRSVLTHTRPEQFASDLMEGLRNVREQRGENLKKNLDRIAHENPYGGYDAGDQENIQPRYVFSGKHTSGGKDDLSSDRERGREKYFPFPDRGALQTDGPALGDREAFTQVVEPYTFGEKEGTTAQQNVPKKRSKKGSSGRGHSLDTHGKGESKDLGNGACLPITPEIHVHFSRKQIIMERGIDFVLDGVAIPYLKSADLCFGTRWTGPTCDETTPAFIRQYLNIYVTGPPAYYPAILKPSWCAYCGKDIETRDCECICWLGHTREECVHVCARGFFLSMEAAHAYRDWLRSLEGNEEEKINLCKKIWRSIRGMHLPPDIDEMKEAFQGHMRWAGENAKYWRKLGTAGREKRDRKKQQQTQDGAEMAPMIGMYSVGDGGALLDQEDFEESYVDQEDASGICKKRYQNKKPKDYSEPIPKPYCPMCGWASFIMKGDSYTVCGSCRSSLPGVCKRWREWSLASGAKGSKRGRKAKPKAGASNPVPVPDASKPKKPKGVAKPRTMVRGKSTFVPIDDNTLTIGDMSLTAITPLPKDMTMGLADLPPSLNDIDLEMRGLVGYTKTKQVVDHHAPTNGWPTHKLTQEIRAHARAYPPRDLPRMPTPTMDNTGGVFMLPITGGFNGDVMEGGGRILARYPISENDQSFPSSKEIPSISFSQEELSVIYSRS